MANDPLYIGIMSGTSLDAVDVVAARFHPQLELIASLSLEFPTSLRNELIALTQQGENEIDRMGQADKLLGELYAQAVKTLINKFSLNKNNITAIGCHGQTIRHRPNISTPFTLQIGDANVIAFQTGIITIADFRRKDMAAGGQGAPLVPAFHQAAFASKEHNRLIINIGGMSNVTALPCDGTVSGFDIGPGNILLDAWIQKHTQAAYDKNGSWAASGNVNKTLLASLLAEPYFSQPPPKSTGRELFNLAWLDEKIKLLHEKINPEDVQATLVELTATCISSTIKKYFSAFRHIYICGGGAYNDFLMLRLKALVQPCLLATTATLNLDPRWVEAVAFAWLAKQTLSKHPGNLCNVTGATNPVILGAVYYV